MDLPVNVILYDCHGVYLDDALYWMGKMEEHAEAEEVKIILKLNLLNNLLEYDPFPETRMCRNQIHTSFQRSYCRLGKTGNCLSIIDFSDLMACEVWVRGGGVGWDLKPLINLSDKPNHFFRWADEFVLGVIQNMIVLCDEEEGVVRRTNTPSDEGQNEVDEGKKEDDFESVVPCISLGSFYESLFTPALMKTQKTFDDPDESLQTSDAPQEWW